MKKFLLNGLFLSFFFVVTLSAQTYVGSDQCKTCHDNVNSTLGYNIYQEYMKTGHPYKLNPVNGEAPVYPANTSPGVPVTPTGTTWDDFAYVIGGYGWKARYVKKDGRVWTDDETAQYNLETGGTVAYHLGEEKLYNQGCFKCHTTGDTTEGAWNGVPADSLGTFSEPGIRCEGCHGPGSDHAANPTGVKPPNSGTDLQWQACANCHNRGGISNSIPQSGLYIKHHEQSNEVLASKHGQKNFTCATCHDAHIAVRYPDAAGDGLSGITTKCESCHPTHEVKINGVVKSIDCVDCHMAPATKSAVGMQKGNGWRGDVKTHIMAINTDPVPRDSMFDGGSVKLDGNGLAAVTLDFACLRCHENETLEWASNYAKGIHTNGITTGDYVGDGTCMICHNEVNPDVGYNIYAEYKKTGHPYKLNPVNGAPPVYPENTSPGVPVTPTGTTWDDFAYVIGGYGWKARYVKKDGRIWTDDGTAQYNLETGGTVAYHLGEEKLYNQGCFKCHTTGATTEGSWNGVAADSLGTFAQPGVRCEGCHGPGKNHIADPANNKFDNNVGTDDLKWNVCANCHNRGGISSTIPASGGYIKHHEQSNEVLSSKHGKMNFTCATCHDAHIPLRYENVAGEGLSAIKTECETCHSDKEVTVNGSPKTIDCVDCHMAPATKSAVGMQVGNGWRGDVPTHIFKINTAAVTKDAMFTTDGGSVALDADGIAAVTLDFACLRCHDSKDVAWAATYADSIHQKGIVTGIEEEGELPTQFNLAQNYPNPFNPTTNISFALPNNAQVELNVYDVNGQLVMKLVDDMMPAGYHSVEFDASMLASGVYIYTIKADNFVTSKKMVLMK